MVARRAHLLGRGLTAHTIIDITGAEHLRLALGTIHVENMVVRLHNTQAGTATAKKRGTRYNWHRLAPKTATVTCKCKNPSCPEPKIKS